MRRRIITTALMASTALALALALALGPVAGASAQTVKQVSCSLGLYAQGPPNPSGIQFGLVDCPAPFGKGVHYDSYTVTPTGPGHGRVSGSFKNYFGRGTRSGTFVLTFAGTSPMNIAYTGSITYTGGTGKFKRLRGSGTIECTTTDGGAHKSCTVHSTTTRV